MDLMNYLQIPYSWDGRGFDGANCYGLIVLWYRHELGIEIFDPIHELKNHYEAAASNIMQQESGRDWEIISASEAKKHDVVLIKNKNANPSHAGIILDSRRFIHLMEGPGCNISRISTWKPMIYRYYRHRSLL